MTLVELKVKELIHENALLKKELEKYTWKLVKDFPPPQGKTLLLYMETGILIQGKANVSGIEAWMEKPPSPRKQRGEIK